MKLTNTKIRIKEEKVRKKDRSQRRVRETELGGWSACFPLQIYIMLVNDSSVILYLHHHHHLGWHSHTYTVHFLFTFQFVDSALGPKRGLINTTRARVWKVFNFGQFVLFCHHHPLGVECILKKTPKVLSQSHSVCITWTATFLIVFFSWFTSSLSTTITFSSGTSSMFVVVRIETLSNYH